MEALCTLVFSALCWLVWLSIWIQSVAGQGGTTKVITAPMGETVTLRFHVDVGIVGVGWYRGRDTNDGNQLIIYHPMAGPTQGGGPRFTRRDTVLQDGSLQIIDLDIIHAGDYTAKVILVNNSPQLFMWKLIISDAFPTTMGPDLPTTPATTGILSSTKASDITRGLRTTTYVLPHVTTRAVSSFTTLPTEVPCSCLRITLVLVVLLGIAIIVIVVVLWNKRKPKGEPTYDNGHYEDISGGNQRQPARQPAAEERQYTPLIDPGRSIYEQLQRPLSYPDLPIYDQPQTRQPLYLGNQSQA